MIYLHKAKRRSPRVRDHIMQIAASLYESTSKPDSELPGK